MDPLRPSRPSIYDVAAWAGVSHTTVSRVLNDQINVRKSTRSRVLAVIEQTGYRPSAAARALSTQRAMRIGVIVHAPEQFGPKSTLVAIERAARTLGYGVSVFSASANDGAELAKGTADLVAQGIDALCVVGPGGPFTHALQRIAGAMPVIVVGDEDPGVAFRSVAVNQVEGAAQAMEHLLALGHRSILHLAGPLDTSDARARAGAWRMALREAGLPAAHLIQGDWTSDLGFAVGAHADSVSEVTAVFAANDQMALGLIHGLSTRGLVVPDDISVVGFDDLPDAAHYTPPLTTVRQDFSGLGTAVLDVVMSALKDEPIEDIVRIPARFIPRGSTAPPRQH